METTENAMFVENATQVINGSNSSSHFLTTTASESPVAVGRYSRPPGLISREVAGDVTEAVYCYILPVLVVLGTLGNVMSLVVLWAEKKRDTTNMSLAALAVSDTGYILTTFARQTSCIISKFDPVWARNYTTLMYGQMIVVNICFSRITGVITAIISTERCLAVVLPLKVRDLVTNSRIAIALVLTYVLTFALIGPVFASGESLWVTNPRTNRTYVTYRTTQWYNENKEFADNYRDIFLNTMFRFLPVVLVCCNTIAIIVRLKKASAWRGDSSSQAGQARAAKERKLTTMLLTICGIYLFCTLPGLVFQVFTYITDEFSVFGRYAAMYTMTTSLSILAQFINSSVNFLVYMAMNDRFAKTYVKVFCCKKCLSSTIEKGGAAKTKELKTASTKLTSAGGVSSTADGSSVSKDADPAQVKVKA
ncbi:FMRFamide receptor-like [Aplysia californica]|uniref:FMRFamide receptor-like n=1 Tax=Aplysia californica TaxID=6500 RepID=A0ABM0JBU2_APLCA|nr:FMRFamide receptor-like [Aplysia californica]